jgi:hypothetical protein
VAECVSSDLLGLLKKTRIRHTPRSLIFRLSLILPGLRFSRLTPCHHFGDSPGHEDAQMSFLQGHSGRQQQPARAITHVFR